MPPGRRHMWREARCPSFYKTHRTRWFAACGGNFLFYRESLYEVGVDNKINCDTTPVSQTCF